MTVEKTTANGLRIAYETFGDPACETVLLVMGLGGQLINWDPELCGLLVDEGFHVVRFDNRDTGESTWFEEDLDVMEVMARAGRGEDVTVPYLLRDMAADAVGLLDALGVDRAHVVGVSMGGMIVQEMAVAHPERVASMTSVMSTTGDRDVGQPTAEASAQLLSTPPSSADEAAEAAVAGAQVWGSPEHLDAERVARMARQAYERGFNPRGVARQLAAIFASGSRSEGLAAVSVPAAVVHGTADTLVTPSGGERTAEVMPTAQLHLVEGMGHDLPPALWPRIVEIIAATARRASTVTH